MKTLLKILAGFVAIFALAIAAVLYMTSGLTETADEFFTAVQQDDYDKAHSYLSEDFKLNTDKESLRIYMEQNGFSSFSSSSWDSRSVSGGQGELSGSIHTRSGGAIPVTLGFVKGKQDWKIYSITKPKSGLQVEAYSNPEIPPEAELVQLVHKSTLIFSESVSEGNMDKLYRQISKVWKAQTTSDELSQIFSDFFQLEDALMVLEQHTPQLSDPPEISKDGFMTLKGLYPTQPNQVHFEYKYIYEGLGWKLAGVKVVIK